MLPRNCHSSVLCLGRPCRKRSQEHPKALCACGCICVLNVLYFSLPTIIVCYLHLSAIGHLHRSNIYLYQFHVDK